MEELKKFFKGFFYAGRGIIATIKSERNMRVHLVFMAYMFGILLSTDWFTLSKADWVALIFACALVISLELVNTAVEKTVDMFTDGKYYELAKKAKDAAAGAVLVSAIGAVIIGLVVLLQKDAFIAMYEYFKGNPIMLIPFALSLIVAIAFIFGFGKLFRKKR